MKSAVATSTPSGEVNEPCAARSEIVVGAACNASPLTPRRQLGQPRRGVPPRRAPSWPQRRRRDARRAAGEPCAGSPAHRTDDRSRAPEGRRVDRPRGLLRTGDRRSARTHAAHRRPRDPPDREPPMRPGGPPRLSSWPRRRPCAEPCPQLGDSDPAQPGRSRRSFPEAAASRAQGQPRNRRSEVRILSGAPAPASPRRASGAPAFQVQVRPPDACSLRTREFHRFAGGVVG